MNTTSPGASTPSFTAKTDFTTGSNPDSVSIGDLNGDGKPDMAVGNFSASTVSVLLNTTSPGASTPSFTAKTDFITGNSPDSVSIGDFNGDGKQDLAVTNDLSTVSVLLNTTSPGASTPSFTAKTDFTTGSNPDSVSIGDFNGDGKPDMAVANHNSNTVSVLLNTTPTNISGPTDACIKWSLLSTNAVTSAVGNINGQPESMGVGSSSPFMSIYLPYSNGQRLWVGNTGWVAAPLDPMRYIEFNASPQPGNSLNVTNLSFKYGDFPLATDFNILNFQAYYSTDGWASSTILNSTEIYLNTAMTTFTAQNLNVPVASGQTFSLRIYPYALQDGMAMTPTFAIHNNVAICGTTAPEVLDTGSICGIKYNDLNGDGQQQLTEPVLPGWTINLSYNQAAGPMTMTTTTDKEGKYCFTKLTPGDYKIEEEMQYGWQQTAPPYPGTYTATLAAGQNLDHQNFGNQLIPRTVCVEPPLGMVAWWPLDETSGSTSIDIAGFNNSGTRMNAPTPVTAKVLGGLQFDGLNDYVNVSNQSELNFGTGDFSFDAWINTTDRTGAKILVDKRTSSTGYRGYSFFLMNGKLALQMADGTYTQYFSPVSVADGNWHHIAVTVSRASQTGILFYLDGVDTQFGNPTLRPGSLNNNGLLRIGSQSFSLGYRFKGALDEIELFNRVLTKAEIVAIYKAGSDGKCKRGSICGMKFNDLNCNGVRNTGEPGLPNWTINLTGAATMTDTTDEKGNYCFNNLSAGTYTIAEVNQAGWQQTLPPYQGTYTGPLQAGQNFNMVNFGNVDTTNSPPVANAGTDQNVATGTLVTLNGSGSSDPWNGCGIKSKLTYSWSFTSRPVGSAATLSSATVNLPTFTADKGGLYVLSLVVYDGTLNSAADTVTVTAVPGANFKMPDTGQTTSYTNTFGEDHDYTINPPSYTDNGNGTIRDNVTGLVWQKLDDNATRSWAGATTYCDNLTLGAQTDWRLPSRIELISIVNYGIYNPAINAAFFPGTNSSNYWSSTTSAGNTANAWYVYFYGGYTHYSNKTSTSYVRCVRGQ